jgi:hypothetical protein
VQGGIWIDVRVNWDRVCQVAAFDPFLAGNVSYIRFFVLLLVQNGATTGLSANLCQAVTAYSRIQFQSFSDSMNPVLTGWRSIEAAVVTRLDAIQLLVCATQSCR